MSKLKVELLVEAYKASETKAKGAKWDQYDVVKGLRKMGLSWARIGKLVGKTHSAIRETHNRYQRWEKLGYRDNGKRIPYT